MSLRSTSTSSSRRSRQAEDDGGSLQPRVRMPHRQDISQQNVVDDTANHPSQNDDDDNNSRNSQRRVMNSSTDFDYRYIQDLRVKALEYETSQQAQQWQHQQRQQQKQKQKQQQDDGDDVVVDKTVLLSETEAAERNKSLELILETTTNSSTSRRKASTQHQTSAPTDSSSEKANSIPPTAVARTTTEEMAGPPTDLERARQLLVQAPGAVAVRGPDHSHLESTDSLPIIEQQESVRGDLPAEPALLIEASLVQDDDTRQQQQQEDTAKLLQRIQELEERQVALENEKQQLHVEIPLATDATPVDDTPKEQQESGGENGNDDDNTTKTKQRRCILFAVVGLVVLAAVITGIQILKSDGKDTESSPKGGENPSEGNLPTIPPSISPQSSPSPTDPDDTDSEDSTGRTLQDKLDAVMSFVYNDSIQEEEQEGVSPTTQQAMQWASQDVAFTDPSLFPVLEDDEANLLTLVERFLLAKFYFNFEGNNWNSSFAWLSPRSVCEWEGLQCGVTNRITHIFGYTNNLRGTIPTEMTLLTSLQKLRLEDNRISGQIPTEIGNLKDLTRIGFLHNQLTGALPTELGQLTKLTELDFHENCIEGTFPTELGLLSNLERLYLGVTRLQGDLTPLLCEGNMKKHDALSEVYVDCLKQTVQCECCDVCCNNQRCNDGSAPFHPVCWDS